MYTDLIHVHKDYKTYKFPLNKKILIFFENNFHFLLTGDLILSLLYMMEFDCRDLLKRYEARKFLRQKILFIFSNHELTSGCNLNHNFYFGLKCNHKCF